MEKESYIGSEIKKFDELQELANKKACIVEEVVKNGRKLYPVYQIISLEQKGDSNKYYLSVQSYKYAFSEYYSYKEGIKPNDEENPDTIHLSKIKVFKNKDDIISFHQKGNSSWSTDQLHFKKIDHNSPTGGSRRRLRRRNKSVRRMRRTRRH